MKWRHILIAPALALGIIYLATSIHVAKIVPEIEAYETSCPQHMTDQQCLDFLRNQAALIDQERSSLERAVAAEDFEQLSLSQQIAYISNLIIETRLNIADLEVLIEQRTVEVRMLGEDILSLQNTIDTLTQEINLLEQSIAKRTHSSYKLTFMSPLEILLDSQSLDSMMRKMKYLIETRKKDRAFLFDMALSREELEDEETLLAEKRRDVQSKRNEIESERAELAEERVNLEEQQAQQQVLLAESQRREAEYKKNLADLRGIQNQIDAQVTELIMKLWQEGQLGVGTQVSKGAVIGFQGHTGCSFGSHLHFSINWGNVNPFSGYLSGGGLYQPVRGNSAHAPLDGGILTQTFHMGMAIDIMSTTTGNQNGDYYYAKKGDIPCAPHFEGWLSLRGEGAPVRSILDGTVFASRVDHFGGKYVVVDHGNGLTSLYLHLK